MQSGVYRATGFKRTSRRRQKVFDECNVSRATELTTETVVIPNETQWNEGTEIPHCVRNDINAFLSFPVDTVCEYDYVLVRRVQSEFRAAVTQKNDEVKNGRAAVIDYQGSCPPE